MITLCQKPGWLPGFFFAFFTLLLSAPLVSATDADNNDVNLIIIIDDIGNNRKLGQRTLALPGPLNLAFLPHTPFARSLAEQAHNRGHSIMLHSPMANKNNAKLGPGAMTLDMDEQQWRQTLLDNIHAVPFVQGVNNHMGSLLTESPEAMSVVMNTLQQQGLFFVDSLTTARSVASQQAAAAGLPHLTRDIFLDHVVTPEAISRQFDKAVKVAKNRGIAVVIGHPYPETLQFLDEKLNHSGQHPIKLHSAHQYLYDRLWNAVPSPSSRYQLQPFKLPALQSANDRSH